MKFFFNMGEGTPFPLDILCKNLVNFYKFSRFISEKINSFYQNMFQLMCKKKQAYMAYKSRLNIKLKFID